MLSWATGPENRTVIGHGNGGATTSQRQVEPKNGRAKTVIEDGENEDGSEDAHSENEGATNAGFWSMANLRILKQKKYKFAKHSEPYEDFNRLRFSRYLELVKELSGHKISIRSARAKVRRR